MKKEKITNAWVIWGIIFLAVVVSIFLGFSVYKEFSKKKQVEEDIEILKEQAEKVKQENMTLEEKIAYLGSQDYQKIQAKDKLDLQDPQENVVVITQELLPLDEDKVSKENNNLDKIKHYNEKKSNFSKWWKYFFK